jgi:glycosyltransferase involved in cell wall biosynthesis
MTPGFPKSVFFFHPYFRDGGVERNIAILSREFAARGVRTSTLTLGVENENPSARVSGAPALTHLGVGRAIAAVVPLAKHLRRTRPDILLSFQSYANVIAVLANLLAGRPSRVIVSERTAISQERGVYTARRRNNPLKNALLVLLMRVCYRTADGMTANSHDGARDLETVLGLPPLSVRVLYNPTFDPAIRQKAREPFHHPFFAGHHAAATARIPVIVGAGRLSPQKDFATLVRAFALVRAHRPCRLVIVGEGEERGALQNLAESLGVAVDFDMTGFDVNPWRIIARADVFALSSLWEGLPNVLIEAVALDVPVVSTSCLSGPREILCDGRGGMLVPPGDAAGMAAALVHVLDAPEKARRLAAIAREGLARFETQGAVDAYLHMMVRVKEVP